MNQEKKLLLLIFFLIFVPVLDLIFTLEKLPTKDEEMFLAVSEGWEYFKQQMINILWEIILSLSCDLIKKELGKKVYCWLNVETRLTFLLKMLFQIKSVY